MFGEMLQKLAEITDKLGQILTELKNIRKLLQDRDRKI